MCLAATILKGKVQPLMQWQQSQMRSSSENLKVALKLCRPHILQGEGGERRKSSPQVGISKEAEKRRTEEFASLRGWPQGGARRCRRFIIRSRR